MHKKGVPGTLRDCIQFVLTSIGRPGAFGLVFFRAHHFTPLDQPGWAFAQGDPFLPSPELGPWAPAKTRSEAC